MKVIAIPTENTENNNNQQIPSSPPTINTTSSSGPLALFTDEYLKHMNEILASQSLDTVLDWCCRSLPNLIQVTSFGATGMVVLHALNKLGHKIPTVFLDTLYHFDETIEHAKQVAEQYKLDLHWFRCKYASSRVEFETRFDCTDMWISNPARYEHLTKVEPLERALEELHVSCWISGRRRDQGGLRSTLQILEIDEADGRLKVNPLALWTQSEVWDYLKREGVSYNPLFDKSYTSIGDSVTTTKNDDPSKGERGGRFYQFEGKTECGIHNRRRPEVIIQPSNIDTPLPNTTVSSS